MTNSTLLGLTIYLFGSGLAFFLGVVCVWSSIALFILSEIILRRRLWISRAATILGTLGLILISLSATPLPYGFYILAGSLTFAWLIVEHSSSLKIRQQRARLRAATALVWFMGGWWELPYQYSPPVVAAGNPPLFIIADSITAGLGELEAVTWPAIIERAHHLEVNDFSKMGAGVVAAYKQADRLPQAAGLVLMEIGGNDLLGTTSLSAYEQGLESLLARVCTPGRTVIMFEVPLPPFCNEFGRIQRKLAARHGVPLVPKRLLIQILSTPGNTLDSIHLSQAGHDQMADLVWRLIQSAYRTSGNRGGNLETH